MAANGGEVFLIGAGASVLESVCGKVGVDTGAAHVNNRSPFFRRETMNKPALSRKVVPLSKSLNHQLNMYTLAATAAGVGLIALKPLAEAKIIYTKANEQIVANVSLDLNNDGIADFTLVGYNFSSISSFTNQLYMYSAGGNSGKNQAIAKVRKGSINSAYALRPGARIGPNGKFKAGACDMLAFSGGADNGSTFSSGGAWANDGKGLKNRYLGLTFQISGQTHYGWARIKTTMQYLEGTLTGYAYETVANKSIIAGQTSGPDVETLEAVSLSHLAHGRSRIPLRRRPGYNCEINP
jgi:hypothetical protein